jgi:hypothetical protein
VEEKTSGILNSADAAFAFAMSRRERAVTLQLRDNANPGINRRTACKPNPAIPNRTIGSEK